LGGKRPPDPLHLPSESGGHPATVFERARGESNSVGAAGDERTVPMSWPLALGFNFLLALDGSLETCVLTGVASGTVFFGRLEDA
jgi:hypothetical protein